jgi:predicted nucleic acid binding AN1-type Zn finger protein
MDKPEQQNLSPKTKKKINRCNVCKKKIIVNITCTKCDNVFCIKHRCPENHNCIHDYKKDFQIPEKIITSKIKAI